MSGEKRKIVKRGLEQRSKEVGNKRWSGREKQKWTESRREKLKSSAGGKQGW